MNTAENIEIKNKPDSVTPWNHFYLDRNVHLDNMWQAGYRPGIVDYQNKPVMPARLNIGPDSLLKLSVNTPGVKEVMDDLLAFTGSSINPLGLISPYFLECSVRDTQSASKRWHDKPDNIALFGKYLRVNYKPLPGGLPGISSLSIYTLGLKLVFPDVQLVSNVFNEPLHYVYKGVARQWWFPLSIADNVPYYNDIVRQVKANLSPRQTANTAFIKVYDEESLAEHLQGLRSHYFTGLL